MLSSHVGNRFTSRFRPMFIYILKGKKIMNTLTAQLLLRYGLYQVPSDYIFVLSKSIISSVSISTFYLSSHFQNCCNYYLPFTFHPIFCVSGLRNEYGGLVYLCLVAAFSTLLLLWSPPFVSLESSLAKDLVFCKVWDVHFHRLSVLFRCKFTVCVFSWYYAIHTFRWILHVCISQI